MINDKFEFIKRFINKENRDLREADVRYQIIDNLFKKILSWPDEKVKCEDYVHSGYIKQKVTIKRKDATGVQEEFQINILLSGAGSDLLQAIALCPEGTTFG